MNRVNGEMRRCERCGNSQFVSDDFFGYALQWGKWQEIRVPKYGYLDSRYTICIACYKEYKKRFNAFMRERPNLDEEHPNLDEVNIAMTEYRTL